MKDLLLKIQSHITKESIKKFMESYTCMIILSIASFMCYGLRLEYLSYILLAFTFFFISISHASYISLPNIFMLFNACKHTVPNLKNPLFWIIVAMGIASLVFFIIDMRTREFKKLKNNWILYSSLALFVVILVSLVRAPILMESLSEAVLYFINIVAYSLIFLTIEFTEENKDKLCISFILVSFLLFAEMTFEFIVQFPTLGMSLMEVISWKHLTLTYANINHFAAMYNICFYVMFYYYIRHPEFKKRILTIIGMVMFLIMTFYTNSRGGLLGLAISLPVLIYAYIRYTKNWKNEIPYLSIVFAGIILALIVCIKIDVFSKLKELNILTLSLRGREDIYQAGIQVFKEHPILGAGWGSSHYYIMTLCEKDRDIYNYHNYILQIGATVGSIGLVVFFTFLILNAIQCFKKGLYHSILLAVLVYLLVHGFLDTMFYNPLLMPLYFILLPGLLYKEENQVELEATI